MKNITFLIIVSGLLLSCQQRTENTTHITGAGPTLPTEPSGLGGGDTVGGGSTINKKPIESNAVKVVETPAYQLRVHPLIEKMKVHYPRLAADFIHLASRRTWYFIPASLEDISSKILGTYSKTDQAALQDLNAVWFNSKLYQEMQLADQGDLLVHELVMGVRLLEFKSRYERCLAKAALLLFEVQIEPENKHAGATLACRNNYAVSDPFNQQQKFTIGSDDYNAIRNIVIELISVEPNWTQIRQIIEEYNVRDHSD